MGMAYGAVLVGLEAYVVGYSVRITDFLFAMLCYAPVGYLLGALIGSVFLAAEYFRRFFGRMRGRPASNRGSGPSIYH